MSDSNEKAPQYLIEESTEDQRSVMRVYAVSDVAGALVLPECIARYTSESRQQNIVIAVGENGPIGAGVALADLSKTINLLPVDQADAVEQAARFMTTHRASAEPDMDDAFSDLVKDRVRELVTEALGLQQPEQDVTPQPELHTGFYL